MKKWIIGLFCIALAILIMPAAKQDIKASISIFTVSIPKTISTDAIISVSAELDTYDILKIETSEAVTLTENITGVQKDCNIETDRSTFTKTDIEAGINKINLSIDASELSAGRWTGSFDSEDKYPEVRQAVTQNANTPQEVLIKLLKDCNTREIAAGNSKITSDILAEALNNNDGYAHWIAAKNPDTPSEVLIKLSKDKNKDVSITALHSMSCQTCQNKDLSK